MNNKKSGISEYFEELKRRKVVRVAIAYVVGSWLLMQVADATFEPLSLPQWSTTLVLWLLALGFPVALILAWALEVTPEGIRRTQKRRKPAGKKTNGSGDQSKPSIAVLPFVDMSPEKDQDHFCEGMAEEIINSLARIRGVHVASRTATFQFKDTTMDIDTIGERLNVNTVLEGSVRKAGNQLRVTAQLINVDDGYHIWSEGFDRELKDVFGIQKEIADKKRYHKERHQDPEQFVRDYLKRQFALKRIEHAGHLKEYLVVPAQCPDLSSVLIPRGLSYYIIGSRPSIEYGPVSFSDYPHRGIHIIKYDIFR